MPNIKDEFILFLTDLIEMVDKEEVDDPEEIDGYINDNVELMKNYLSLIKGE
jgi:hypothetical protein